MEYAIKAAKSSGLTTVAIRGADSVCVATQKKIPDALTDPEYLTNIYNITPSVGCIITGLPADGRSLVIRARQIAADFQDKNGYECPVHWLAYKVANLGQLYTQHAYMRPYGVSAIFFAIDEEKGPQLFDFKAKDVDVAVVSVSDRRVRKLKENEIDDYLTAIAEKD